MDKATVNRELKTAIMAMRLPKNHPLRRKIARRLTSVLREVTRDRNYVRRDAIRRVVV